MTELPLLRAEPIYQLERDPRHPGVWQIYGLNLLGWDDLPDIDPLFAFKVALVCLLSDDPAPTVLVGGYTLKNAHWRECPGDDLTEVDTSIYGGDLFPVVEGLPGAEERLAASAEAADQAVPQLPWFSATWERLRRDDLFLCYRDPQA